MLVDSDPPLLFSFLLFNGLLSPATSPFAWLPFVWYRFVFVLKFLKVLVFGLPYRFFIYVKLFCAEDPFHIGDSFVCCITVSCLVYKVT